MFSGDCGGLKPGTANPNYVSFIGTFVKIILTEKVKLDFSQKLQILEQRWPTQIDLRAGSEKSCPKYQLFGPH
jgi:hypothetical protein